MLRNTAQVVGVSSICVGGLIGVGQLLRYNPLSNPIGQQSEIEEQYPTSYKFVKSNEAMYQEARKFRNYHSDWEKPTSSFEKLNIYKYSDNVMWFCNNMQPKSYDDKKQRRQCVTAYYKWQRTIQSSNVGQYHN